MRLAVASPPWAKAVASPVASSRSIASRAARRPSGSSLRNKSIRLIRRPSSSPSPAWRASAGLQLDGARARLPAPRGAHPPSPARRAGAPSPPTRSAWRRANCERVEQLRLGERADQEMGGAMLVEDRRARRRRCARAGRARPPHWPRPHRRPRAPPPAPRRARRAHRPPPPRRRRRRSAPRHCPRAARRSAASRRPRPAGVSSSR